MKMTIDEAMAIIRKEYLCVDRDCDIERNCGKCDLMMPSKEPILEAYKMAIKALEQEPKTGHWEMCEDADGIYGVCDICGTDADFTHYGKAYPYCPNCGAKMESEDKE